MSVIAQRNAHLGEASQTSGDTCPATIFPDSVGSRVMALSQTHDRTVLVSIVTACKTETPSAAKFAVTEESCSRSAYPGPERHACGAEEALSSGSEVHLRPAVCRQQGSRLGATYADSAEPLGQVTHLRRLTALRKQHARAISCAAPAGPRTSAQPGARSGEHHSRSAAVQRSATRQDSPGTRVRFEPFPSGDGCDPRRPRSDA